LLKQKKARAFREGERKMVRVTIEFKLKAKKLKRGKVTVGVLSPKISRWETK
jgi:hypothetical protein